MEAGFVIIIRVIAASIFANIGSKRNIGGTWAFILTFLLGFIGWIIVLCSKKKDTPTFTDMTKGGNA